MLKLTDPLLTRAESKAISVFRLKVSASRAPAGTLISRPSDRRMLSAILACIVRRCAVADRIADNRVDRTRPIAKIWVNGLSAWCDTTRAPARRCKVANYLRIWAAPRKL